MSLFEVRLTTGPMRDPRFIDATSVGLRVERDGERYQYFVLVASGQDLELAHSELSRHPLFWEAAVQAAAEALPVRVRQDDVPLTDPTQPIDLLVDFHRVQDLLEESETLPSIEPGTVVASWEA